MSRLKSLRQAKGITQKEISQKLKISERQYRRLEQDEAKLTLDRANDIARILDIDLNTLFGRQTIIM